MTNKQIKVMQDAARSLSMLIARNATAKLIPQDVIQIHELHLTELKKLIEFGKNPELHHNSEWED